MRVSRIAACSLSVLVAVFLSGCPSQESTNTTNSSNVPASASAPAGPEVAVAPLPPEAERNTPSFLEPAKPSDAKPCQALPDGTGLAHEIARVTRELACTPGLFYKTPSELEAALKPPKGVSVRFSGPRFVEVKFETAPTAQELATAMGVKQPVITTATKGAWATRNWYLGSNQTTGKLDLWGPGIASVAVSHRGELKDTIGAVKKLTDETLRGYIIVAMPDEVVAVKDDEVAWKMLQHAVTKLAGMPKLLEQEPEAIAKQLGIDDPRFNVTRVSVGTGPSAIKGIDIWMARTQIAAAPVITTFDFKGKIEHERAHDSDTIVLHQTGTPPGTSGDEHAWHGLSIRPSFDPRKGVKLKNDNDPKDYTLEGLRIMP
ncbi:MAG: hypothetical protein H6718_07470 [Polyangiaceae bacterium]|nr:hypothetical protein [Polyangiaceae bacterium]